MSSPFPASPSPYKDLPSFPKPKSRNKVPIILGVVLGVVGVAVVFALGFFVGKSSVPVAAGSDDDNATTSIFEIQRDSGSSPWKPGAVSGGMGEAVDSDGVRLTVTDVAENESIDLMVNWSDGEGAATEPMTATTGGKFVLVTTEVENTGTEAWDLTCMGSVQAKLADDQGRHFQPTDELYKIPGNPGCNENTNPGFTKTMKWAFEVPQDARGFKLGFADPEINYDKLTYVKLD